VVVLDDEIVIGLVDQLDQWNQKLDQYDSGKSYVLVVLDLGERKQLGDDVDLECLELFNNLGHRSL